MNVVYKPDADVQEYIYDKLKYAPVVLHILELYKAYSLRFCSLSNKAGLAAAVTVLRKFVTGVAAACSILSIFLTGIYSHVRQAQTGQLQSLF